MSQIHAWSQQIDASHVLFIFDSCFSGTIFKAKSSSGLPPHIAAATVKPVRQFISAGSAGQKVPAKSVFTPHVARGLGGEADLDSDGYVTGTELGMYLHKEVLAYGQGQTPRYGKILDPDLNEGDFVFRLPRRPAPPPPPLFAPPTGTPTTEDLQRQADEIEANKKQWAEWLAGLEGQVAKAEAFELRDVPAKLKMEFWQRLVDSYTEDDPYSIVDDSLRKRSLERLDIWRQAVLHEDIAPEQIDGLRAGDLLEDPITGTRLRYIPGGRFKMGSPSSEKGRDDDETLHDVELTRGFWMGETKVTQGQWRQLMGNTLTIRRGIFPCDDCPVAGVSWWDAVIYTNRLSSKAGLQSCYKLSGCQGTPNEGDYFCEEVALKGLGCEGYRLPTEAEWERAARAGTETPYWTGETLTTEQANFGHEWGGFSNPTKGRSFPANPWGLYDVHGNFKEWVWDYFERAYPTRLVKDPVGPRESRMRAVRGNSRYGNASTARAARRSGYMPMSLDDTVGFRLARGQGQ